MEELFKRCGLTLEEEKEDKDTLSRAVITGKNPKPVKFDKNSLPEIGAGANYPQVVAKLKSIARNLGGQSEIPVRGLLFGETTTHSYNIITSD